VTITITDEFREKVDKAARSVAGNSTTGFDWEDISQSMWVWFLENPKQYGDYTILEDPFKQLKKVAKQEVSKANNAWEWYSGQYTYTPTEVRGLLNEYLFDVTIEAIAEHTDLVEGLLMLKTDAPSYFKAVIDKWVNNNEGHTGRTTEAVDKLALLMNKVNQAARYSYEGPGSRRAVTNTQAIARKEQE
jgi:hypothetical protein